MAEPRAVRYLAREVRQWRAKNKCFSCHNNGDAARALYAAKRFGLRFDADALETTNLWLTRPDDWKHNGPKGEFSDKKLAAIQFAAALAAAVDTQAVENDAALLRAAEIVHGYQERDGSWKVDAGGLAGSPVTYGQPLATVAARRVLAKADSTRFAKALQRSDRWLRRQRPRGVLDSAAVLVGLAQIDQTKHAGPIQKQQHHCLDVIRKGEDSQRGGWGPFVSSRPEVFDTAVVLLGLATVRDQRGVRKMISRGRSHLVKSQEADGSWTETTRPPGAESYAQRISTSAWATLALIQTREAGEERR